MDYIVRVAGRPAVYRPEPLIEALHEQIREHWRRYRRQQRVLRKLGPGGRARAVWQTAVEDTEDTLRTLFAIRRAGRVRR